MYTVKPLQQSSQIQIKDRNVAIIYCPDSCIKADAILCTHSQLHGLPKAQFHRSPGDSGAVQAKIPGENRSSICSGLACAESSYVLSADVCKMKRIMQIFSRVPHFKPGSSWAWAGVRKRNQTLRPLTPAEIKLWLQPCTNSCTELNWGFLPTDTHLLHSIEQ